MKNTLKQPMSKIYINLDPEDDDLYFTSETAREAPVEYIVIS